MFFEMFDTVILPIPVKNWLSISLREVCLHSKFGKHSFSTRRNMTDKQNHMIKSILCHQHLRRIVLRLLPRYVFPIWVSWLPLLGKESSGSASVYEISATKYTTWFTFSLLFWRQLFWNKLNGWNKNFFNFLFNFVSPTLSHFLITKNSSWGKQSRGLGKLLSIR